MSYQRTPAEISFDKRYEELVNSGIDIPNMTFNTEEEMINFCEENDLVTA